MKTREVRVYAYCPFNSNTKYYVGTFLDFGIKQSGITAAIIEKENGTIESVDLGCVQFIDKSPLTQLNG